MDKPGFRLSRLWRNAALLLASCLLLGAACADPPGRVGRIAEFTGNVWFYDADQGEWTQAVRNRPLTSGDRLSSDREARAELQIGSTTLRLDGGSEVELQRVDDDNLRLQLISGGVALRVRSAEVLREAEVITAEGRFVPLQTGYYRIDRRDDATLAGAWSGQLRFEASDSTLVINAGQRAEFWQEGPQRSTHYTWASFDNDPFAQWAVGEERRDEQRAASRYVSPEMTGAEDLDRYGRWDSHPEYGTVWTPYRVSPAWAPYRYGHWAWVQPWGWTWVDDAPWGFAPFHYGRWVSWRGHWCWAPGSYVARPVYAPALVAWIGSGHVSVGVSVGSPGYVGWVPLGPREVWYPHYRASPGYVRNVNVTHVHGYRDWRSGPPPQPAMYTNRGVPGGVTVVPSNVLRDRQPIPQAVSRIDPSLSRRIVAEQRIHHEAPPAPTRTAVAPPTVIPPAPGRVVIEPRRDDEFRPRVRPTRDPRLGAPPEPPRVQQAPPVAPMQPVQAAQPMPLARPAPEPAAVARPAPEWQRGGGFQQRDDDGRGRGRGHQQSPQAQPPQPPQQPQPPQITRPTPPQQPRVVQAPPPAPPQPAPQAVAPPPQPQPQHAGPGRRGWDDNGGGRGRRDEVEPRRGGQNN